MDKAGVTLVGAEAEAKRTLEGFGFVVRKVPTTSERTADFDVEGDDPAYYVEVKSRLLDERLAKPTAPIGKAVTKPMRHDAKVGQWLADARQQFSTLDPGHERLWFVWASMEARFDSGDSQVERTISVLYGVREAMDVDPPHRLLVVFYAKTPAFDRFSDIDGMVVVIPGRGITFCPNETSPRFDTVMSSKLVRDLRKMGVTEMLPSERAAGKDAYVVPRAVLQAGDGAVLRDVQRWANLPYLNFMAIEEEYMQTGRIVLAGPEP